MSRPKSEATIQRERDRAIRKERRELKRKEREERRQLRLRKRVTRESVVKNGVPGIKRSGETLSLQAALAHNPCDGCHRIVGNVEIVSRFCGTCEYGEEVVHSPKILKAKQGDLEGESGQNRLLFQHIKQGGDDAPINASRA